MTDNFERKVAVDGPVVNEGDFGDKLLTQPAGTLLRRHMAGFYSAVDTFPHQEP